MKIGDREHAFILKKQRSGRIRDNRAPPTTISDNPIELAAGAPLISAARLR
jgi:hypothetical protein